jgi:hypothetical protein
MAGNASTKKQYASIKGLPAGTTQPSKTVSMGNHRGHYTGELSGGGGSEKFAAPMQEVVAAIKGIGGTYDDIGEKSGFITDGYLDKSSIPYGESAKFNFLPPGMDISNQENAEIHEMPMRKLTAESYPGDGWMPAPRDMPE